MSSSSGDELAKYNRRINDTLDKQLQQLSLSASAADHNNSPGHSSASTELWAVAQHLDSTDIKFDDAYEDSVPSSHADHTVMSPPEQPHHHHHHHHRKHRPRTTPHKKEFQEWQKPSLVSQARESPATPAKYKIDNSRGSDDHKHIDERSRATEASDLVRATSQGAVGALPDDGFAADDEQGDCDSESGSAPEGLVLPLDDELCAELEARLKGDAAIPPLYKLFEERSAELDKNLTRMRNLAQQVARATELQTKREEKLQKLRDILDHGSDASFRETYTKQDKALEEEVRQLRELQNAEKTRCVALVAELRSADHDSRRLHALIVEREKEIARARDHLSTLQRRDVYSSQERQKIKEEEVQLDQIMATNRQLTERIAGRQSELYRLRAAFDANVQMHRSIQLREEEAVLLNEELADIRAKHSKLSLSLEEQSNELGVAEAQARIARRNAQLAHRAYSFLVKRIIASSHDPADATVPEDSESDSELSTVQQQLTSRLDNVTQLISAVSQRAPSNFAYPYDATNNHPSRQLLEVDNSRSRSREGDRDHARTRRARSCSSVTSTTHSTVRAKKLSTPIQLPEIAPDDFVNFCRDLAAAARSGGGLPAVNTAAASWTHRTGVPGTALRFCINQPAVRADPRSKGALNDFLAACFVAGIR